MELEQNQCYVIPFGNKKYVDQTGDSLHFVCWLKRWLAMKFITLKSKLYNSPLLHGLSLNPCHDTYICFIGRNLDLLTTINFKYLQTTSFSDFCMWDKNNGFNTCIMQNIFGYFLLKVFTRIGIRLYDKQGLKFEAKCFKSRWRLYIYI